MLAILAALDCETETGSWSGLSCTWAWSNWLRIHGADRRLEKSLQTEWHICVNPGRYFWAAAPDWGNPRPVGPWTSFPNMHGHTDTHNYGGNPHKHKRPKGTAVLLCLILNDKVTWRPLGHLRGIYSPQYDRKLLKQSCSYFLYLPSLFAFKSAPVSLLACVFSL